MEMAFAFFGGGRHGRGVSLPFVHRVGLHGLFLGVLVVSGPARNPHWPVNELREFSGGFGNFFTDSSWVAGASYLLRVGGRESAR